MANIIDRMRYHADHHALLLTQAELLRWITLLSTLVDSMEPYDDMDRTIGHRHVGVHEWDALFVDYQQEVDDA